MIGVGHALEDVGKPAKRHQITLISRFSTRHRSIYGQGGGLSWPKWPAAESTVSHLTRFFATTDSASTTKTFGRYGV
eukprot:9500197-Pyramimonas_sp.AAC.1